MLYNLGQIADSPKYRGFFIFKIPFPLLSTILKTEILKFIKRDRFEICKNVKKRSHDAWTVSQHLCNISVH